MNEKLMEELIECLEAHTKATRAISHGDVNGPSGLEGLTMAIADISPPRTTLTDAVGRIADALEKIAAAMEEKNNS